MPDIRRAPLRWIVVTVAIVICALIAILAAGYTVSTARTATRQEGEIIVLKAAAVQANKLRASEKRAAKLRSQAECRGRIAGAKQGTTIIEDLRATYLELAASAVNPEFVAALKQRAAHLPKFPAPDCDPGPKTQPKGTTS